MMLSQQMVAYRTEPKEAAPLLLIIPTSSAPLNSITCTKSCLVGSQAVGENYQQIDCGPEWLIMAICSSLWRLFVFLLSE
jgi:hypothetical protein